MRAAVLALLTLVLFGCQSAPGGEVRLATLEPGKSIGDQAQLILGGISIPVDVKSQTEGGTVKWSFERHGQVIEVEEYESTPGSFRLVSASGEVYDPPMELLRDRVKIGEEWRWNGTAHSQLPGSPAASTGTKTPAEATIQMVNDTVNIPGGPFNARRVEVHLRIKDGSPRPLSRKLQFWFVEGRGMLKREFAMSSTRTTPELVP